ncbi:type II secretion system protein [Planctomycetota bacterium]
MKQKKGFTLVELLVVIAIIALLMGILMPALARVRQLAFRMTCGTNLAGIGKAMLIYANDYEDELPKAGGRSNTWVTTLPNWLSQAGRKAAYGIGTTNEGQVTVSSSFYLLVKYAEVTPKSFVCKGESDTTEFILSDWTTDTTLELTKVWDFGKYDSADINQSKHCSYGYQVPFGSYALTVAHEPTMAVAADRNPWLDPSVTLTDDWGPYRPDVEGLANTTTDMAKLGNSRAHQMEGQNVLFLDSHVSFEKRATAGIESDNIYTKQPVSGNTLEGRAKGEMPQPGNSSFYTTMASRKDSCLLQEGLQGSSGGASGGGGR